LLVPSTRASRLQAAAGPGSPVLIRIARRPRRQRPARCGPSAPRRCATRRRPVSRPFCLLAPDTGQPRGRPAA